MCVVTWDQRLEIMRLSNVVGLRTQKELILISFKALFFVSCKFIKMLLCSLTHLFKTNQFEKLSAENLYITCGSSANLFAFFQRTPFLVSKKSRI